MIMFNEIANKSFELIDGIAYFVPEKELDYNVKYSEAIISGNCMEKNWKEHFKHKSEDILNVAKRISSMGGLILEIGTGPGGGFMPYVLDEDVNADLIISDLCPTVVKEWKKLFDKSIKPANIKYAALNTCDLPFKDGTINVVSGNGGFGNIEGDKRKALNEIYRVIKHGGIYVTGDICITNEYVKNIPEKAYNVLKERFPDIFIDFYQETFDAGFSKIENEIGNSWSNENDDSDLASLCRELGIYLVFSTYLRYCYKE
jgi:ubiquinone/menaquinone biosynthesis C-methylase UbiE